jgi:uncharacterized protein
MVFAGFALGLFGGGGSILTVPVLVYLFGIPASLATVYSLFVVGITSLVGSSGYLHRKLVDFRSGALFLLPSMLSVWMARRVLLPAIPDSLFQWGSFVLTKDRLILVTFAALMAWASYSMLRRQRPERGVSETNPKPGRFLIYGFVAGSLMGFVGAGGGFLIVPALADLGKMPMKAAVGTSLVIIAVSSLWGFGSELWSAPNLDWSFLARLCGLALAGVFVGEQAGKRVSSRALKRGFGWMILVVSFWMVLKEIFLQ